MQFHDAFHNFFYDMGYIRYPMYVATVFMLLQIVRASLPARTPGFSPRSAMTTHSILIWGFLNALLGVLGTFLGLALGLSSVERAGQVESSLLAGGLKISLYPSIFGLLLLTVAIVAWLVLQAFRRSGTDAAGATQAA